jgi:hypothetical protein
MESHRVVRALPAILALILAFATGVYSIGYFAASEIWWVETTKLRCYASDWQVRLFAPAARIETALTSKSVEVCRTPETE